MSFKLDGQMQYTSQNKIDSRLEPFLKKNLYLTSLSKIRTAVEDLPYVKNVIVKRLPPHTIYLKIIEHEPIALYVAEEDKTYPISEEGEIIPDNALLDLPLILTKESIPQTPKLILYLKSYPFVQEKISGAEWVGNRRWNIHFDTCEVHLSENLGESLNRLNLLIKDKNKICSGVLDLRDSKRVFLTQ
ncbi:MAG: FtsQ-type POTRA domain-containing protein [Alphaproteobacteria bacterium]|nr:FtsQ-type POTRA domain-containing protein [Alphaproteobacteria bacterium]